MSEGIDPQGGEVEVSPEEERFLKRFFRRQALPWFVLAAVISVTSAWGLRGEADDALEARTSAALVQLRSERRCPPPWPARVASASAPARHRRAGRE